MSVFKNLIVYRVVPGWPGPDAPSDLLLQLDAALGKARFVPCGASQERAAGWVEPRGEAHGPLVESVAGQWLLRFMVEAKVVPGAVLRRKVEEKAVEIEKSTGRKPGRREMKELKEDLLMQLLPMAFTKQGAVNVWVDPDARLVAVDASSQGRADEVMTALVEALPGLSTALLDTRTGAAAAMSQWLLSQEPPAGFSIDRECELKASDASKAAVRYARHALDIDEVRQHIEQGKVPTRLALTWDGRVSFVLTEGLQIKKIAFLEAVFDGGGNESRKGEGFDADAAISTGELRRLIPDLISALGGEVGEAAAA